MNLPDAGMVLGRYTLDRLLGQGGFAWVFAASRDDGNSFAVKLLKPRFGIDNAFRQRFLQESELAAQLRHPHIVHIEEVGRSGDRVFFAMDLYPDTLAARLGRGGALPEADVLRMGADVARALAFAHDSGIVHRDIKLDNVLLAADGTAVLTDFGLARAINGYAAATGYSTTIGTPSYISPEQAQGRTLDGRSDLYSLGITLYQAATGELPFRSQDWFELARMHVETRPEPPRSRRPELTRRLERIILKLLAKHPDDRYPDAQALLEDLEHPSHRRTSDISLPAGWVTAESRTPPAPEEKRPWWRRFRK